MLKNVFKFLLFLLIIGSAIVIIIIIGSRVDEIDNLNDTINDTTSVMKNTNAKNIIKYVEDAYEAAYIKNYSYPTLRDVKESFNINKVNWNNDYIIEAEGFNCTVEVINNNLKVKCLDYETNNNLKLSN